MDSRPDQPPASKNSTKQQPVTSVHPVTDYKILLPTRFDGDAASPFAAREFTHWHATFANFLQGMGDDLNRLSVLTNFVSSRVYEYVQDCKTFDEAINALKVIYVKRTNEIYARHLLATRKQQPGESLDDFYQALRSLSKNCNFRAVTAEVYTQEAIREAFISGLQSGAIRQRLLENEELDLSNTLRQSSSMDSALVSRLEIPIIRSKGKISMAAGRMELFTLGHCFMEIKIADVIYRDIRLSVLENLCCPIVFGHDFMKNHSCITFDFGGKRPQLSICALSFSAFH